MSQFPDNLISKFSRIYVAQKSFKDDSGKTVDYERLCLEYMVGGEPIVIEIKPDDAMKKDFKLLKIADDLSKGALGTPAPEQGF